MENYCGKDCGTCTWRESQNCPGCQNGPGRALSGDCEIAKCCREKGHENCNTCSFHSSCWTLKGRERAPEFRQQVMEHRAEEQRRLEQRAPLVGKWLWILFWLVIPGTIASFMTHESIVEWAPALQFPGEILNAVCSFAYGLILLKLALVVQRYRTAAYCVLAAAGVDLVLTLLGSEQSSPLWWILMLPAVAVGLAAEYQEYHAHAEVLAGADTDLAEKWRNLWKWYIGSMIALFACIVVVLIAPLLGLLATLAALIAMLVVSILKLVYLYRTAEWFRNYTPQERMALPDETSL